MEGTVSDKQNEFTKGWCLFLSKINRANSKGFPGGSVVKNLPANTGDMDLTPGSGRSPGEGNDNPLRHSYLGNPMERGAWRATVDGVTKGSD